MPTSDDINEWNKAALDYAEKVRQGICPACEIKDKEIVKLKNELEIMESCVQLEAEPLPCGHSQQYAWCETNKYDKIICLVCRKEANEEKIKELENGNA